jgi:hypothetical protein
MTAVSSPLLLLIPHQHLGIGAVMMGVLITTIIMKTLTFTPSIFIMDKNTTTRYNPMDHLQDMQDLAFLRGVEQVRNDRWEHTCLDWNAHVTQLQHEGSFENEYLMSLRAHGKLIRILDLLLQQKEYNSRGPEPILVEHIVGNGLRIVSGGRPKCQRWIFGMCKDASYKAFIDFINANALNTGGMEYNLRTIQTKEYR